MYRVTGYQTIGLMDQVRVRICPLALVQCIVKCDHISVYALLSFTLLYMRICACPDIDEKKRRMEKVKKNREKRCCTVENACNLTEVNAISLSVASPQSNAGSLSPVSVSNLAVPPVSLPAVLQPENTNLLILSHLPGVAVVNDADVASPVSSVVSSVDSQIVRRLTPEESHMLHELNQVYDLSFTVDLEPLVHIRQLDPSLNQLVNQSSITVLRLIKFAKRLDEFVRLSQVCVTCYGLP